MKRKLSVLPLVLLLPLPLAAQATPQVPTSTVQVASAVSPLPEEFRENATVLGYARDGRGLVPLRIGAGPFVCLASDPAAERFHVACYHQSLEPFMARGRELREQGTADAQVDTVRYAEIESGELPMPRTPAALYSLTAPDSMYDRNTGEVKGARRLYVVYIPFATSESTGLPAKPAPDQPWIMFPGTPKAHIMFFPSMNP